MRSKFEYLLTEAAKVMLLKEDMLPPAGAPPLSTQPPDPGQQQQPPPQQQPPAPGAPPTQQPALTVDMIIDRLNVIRGGKSFTEPETYKAMSDFFNTVPQTEREVVDRFLTGLGSVVINAPGGSQPQDQSQVNTTQQMGQPPPPSAPPPSSASPPAPAPIGAM